MPHQESRQHAPRARWRPAGHARASPAAPRGPTAGNPAWATASRRGCPSGSAARRGPRSRGAVPSIGLAAGARIVQAPGLPPAPAPGACRAALQSGAGHGPPFVAAASSRTGARRFNRARAHVPGTEHASPGGRPRAPHAAVPSAALHLRGHFAQLPRAKISVLGILLTVATPYRFDFFWGKKVLPFLYPSTAERVEPGAKACFRCGGGCAAGNCCSSHSRAEPRALSTSLRTGCSRAPGPPAAPRSLRRAGPRGKGPDGHTPRSQGGCEARRGQGGQSCQVQGELRRRHPAGFCLCVRACVRHRIRAPSQYTIAGARPTKADSDPARPYVCCVCCAMRVRCGCGVLLLTACLSLALCPDDGSRQQIGRTLSEPPHARQHQPARRRLNCTRPLPRLPVPRCLRSAALRERDPRKKSAPCALNPIPNP
jgi:hypothetical protein